MALSEEECVFEGSFEGVDVGEDGSPGNASGEQTHAAVYIGADSVGDYGVEGGGDDRAYGGDRARVKVWGGTGGAGGLFGGIWTADVGEVEELLSCFEFKLKGVVGSVSSEEDLGGGICMRIGNGKNA